MGWSCSAKASYVYHAITALVGEKSSNSLPNDGGFYEGSRKEHADGAITGTVWKKTKTYTPEERAAEAKARNIPDPSWVGDPCKKAGSFKISGDGKIERFPLLPKEIKAAAEAKGAAEYTRIHGSL